MLSSNQSKRNISTPSSIKVNNTQVSKKSRFSSSPKNTDKSAKTHGFASTQGKSRPIGYCIDQMLYIMKLVSTPCSRGSNCAFEHDVVDAKALTTQQKASFISSANKMKASNFKSEVLKEIQ
jgi:hypothetical protein